MEHYNGKWGIGGIVSGLLGSLLVGCVAGDPAHADDPASEEKVPVALHAGQLTRAKHSIRYCCAVPFPETIRLRNGKRKHRWLPTGA